MKSPNFQYPFRHFPGFVRRMSSADPSGPVLLLFTETNGDKGLISAVRFFWNVKRVILTVESTAGNGSYTQYDPLAYFPFEGGEQDETKWVIPPARARDEPGDYLQLGTRGQCSGIAIGDTGNFALWWDATEIVWLTDIERYALLMSGYVTQALYGGPARSGTPPVDAFVFSLRNDADSGGLTAINGSLAFPALLEICPGTSLYQLESANWNNVGGTITVSFELWEYGTNPQPVALDFNKPTNTQLLPAV